MRLRAALIALAVVLALALTGPRLWGYINSYEATDDAQVDSHITPVGARISGTITRVFVDDNQEVKAGQLIAEIDPNDYRIAAERARAELAIAEARVQAAEQTLGLERARLGASEAADDKARRDARRFKLLLDQKVVSEGEYEKFLEAARVERSSADAAHAAIGVATKQLNASHAQAEAAKAALDQALLDLSYTRVTAPAAGIVGKRSVEIGQHVQPGQELLAIVRTDDVWITANFKETQLARIHIGQPATVRVDAFDRDYEGYVESLAGASGEKYSLLPPENATGNYVKVVQRLPVRIRLRRYSDQRPSLRPGMSVEATVWLR